MTEPTIAGPPAHDAPPRWVRPARVGGRWALRVTIAVAGALIAVLLFGRISAPIGPFDATLAFRPAGGNAVVAVPPLGSISADVYDGPLRLEVALQRVDQDRAQALADDPVRLAGVVDEVSSNLQSAIVRLVWTTAGLALLGAAVTSLVVTRRRREPLIAAGITTVLLIGTGGLGAATWRPEALSQPTYSGLLVNATSLIGSAADVVTRFDAYRASLEDIVGNVGTLYAALSSLPVPSGDGATVTLLHISDIHLNPSGFDLVRQVVEQFPIDGVLDTGDITDWGSGPENRLITSVGSLGVPYVFVRGNHDSAATAALVAAQPNATVLDGSSVTIAGIEIAGIPDPRFTPDKSTGDDDAGADVLEASGDVLAGFIETLPAPPPIAMVHDPKQAQPLDGIVPLVLAGHTHDRKVSDLDDGTMLMVQGSTGGAGLRALEGEFPEPLTATVLYLDAETGRLQAYDEITLGGLGETEVTIERHTLPVDTGALAPADDDPATEDTASTDAVPIPDDGTPVDDALRPASPAE